MELRVSRYLTKIEDGSGLKDPSNYGIESLYIPSTAFAFQDYLRALELHLPILAVTSSSSMCNRHILES